MPIGSNTPGAATQRGGFWKGLGKVLGRFWNRFESSLASLGALLSFFFQGFFAQRVQEGPRGGQEVSWARFHVLRTYRRAALWKRKAESECQQGFFAAIPAPCPKMPPRAKYVPTYGQLGAPKSRLERPKARKKRPRGATNAARREKCAQEALKTEKRAKIVPT